MVKSDMKPLSFPVNLFLTVDKYPSHSRGLALEHVHSYESFGKLETGRSRSEVELDSVVC